MNKRTSICSHRSAGFTLIEVLVSMTVTTILVAGMASTIYVTSRANDTTKGPIPGTMEGTRAAQLVAADVQLAQTITTKSANEVAFTVADRTGDGIPETIDYKWSGTPGDPLTVQYNNGTAIPLVSNVQSLQFGYKTQTVAKTTSSQTTVNSGETLLANWTTASWGGSPSLLNRNITTINWTSECFPLTLPANVSNLQITRVRVWLKKTTGLGSTTVGVYTSGSGSIPASQIGSTISKANSALTTSYAPVDFTFTDVPISSPTSSYNILVKGSLSSTGVSLQAYQLGTVTDNTVMRFTDLSGSVWNTGTTNAYDFPFEVYGTYDSTTTTNTTTNRYFVRGVSLKLRVGSDSTSQVSTSTLVLNSPEVTTP